MNSARDFQFAKRLPHARRAAGFLIVALAAAVAFLAAFPASAQSLDDLKNDGNNTDNVLTYGLGYSLQRYSPLKQIDKVSVKRLVPVWSLSLDNPWGEQAQPLVYNGVMYVTDAKATVAIDVATGKQLWKTPVDWPADMVRVVCCGVSNKGAAIYDGKVFRTTLDAFVVGLDMKTGKELWRQKAAEWKDGYSMTAAPLVANGVLITGMSGAEFGTRGFLDGWDRAPASISGAITPSPPPVKREALAGPQATPTSAAAAPHGSPAPTIPIWISFIGVLATPDRGTRKSARVTICIPPPCWRSSPRPAKSPGITNSLRTICMTTTPCGSRSSPTSPLKDSRARWSCSSTATVFSMSLTASTDSFLPPIPTKK